MRPSFRFDAVAPVAATRFRQAPSSKRREAARLACEQAVAATALTAVEAGEALAVLRGAVRQDGALHERLDRLAATLDDEYLRLSEDGGAEGQAFRCFRRARAASALVFALTADAAQLHEALYEALFSLDDPTELVRLLEQTLADG